MLRRPLLALFLLTVLAACKPAAEPASSPESTSAPETTSAPADAAAPATAPEATSEAAPADAAVVDGTGAGATSKPDRAAVEAAAAMQAVPPRYGTDYEILPVPQPTYGSGKIEVAEVFGYTCIHCAHLQPSVDTWKPTLASDVRFEYVPGVFGGVWDNFARAYFAAQIMGVQDKTHDAIFKAIHIERSIKTGDLPEIADLYAKQGVDREKFLATMQSFAVTAKLNRAKQFALRTGVTGTPTMIVAGKYRVSVPQDRGFEGMLSTVDFLLGYERAAAAPAAPMPAAP